jgi:hypothetical protein
MRGGLLSCLLCVSALGAGCGSDSGSTADDAVRNLTEPVTETSTPTTDTKAEEAAAAAERRRAREAERARAVRKRQREAEAARRREAERKKREEEEAQQQAAACHPNYDPCLDPNASDYDCAGGSGDGPEYTGRVTVTGGDPYDLDRDGDGVGCDS